MLRDKWTGVMAHTTSAKQSAGAAVRMIQRMDGETPPDAAGNSIISAYDLLDSALVEMNRALEAAGESGWGGRYGKPR